MKSKISNPGDGGFLYMDLLVALAILSLVMLTLFAGLKQLQLGFAKETQQLQSAIETQQESLISTESLEDSP